MLHVNCVLGISQIEIFCSFLLRKLVNMPRVKNVKSLSEICRDFILVNQDNYCNKASTELENNVNISDSEKPTTNPFDELRKISSFVDLEFFNF